MGKAGRKQKPGRRTKSNRPSRARAMRHDKGCEGVQRRHAAFGAFASETHDAIGRAYAAGLLGPWGRARDYLDAGRKIARQYWRVYGFRTPDSLARFQPSHGYGIDDPVADRIREQVLNDSLATIRAQGRNVELAFTELVIDINPDDGPLWLDRLLQTAGTTHDKERLEAAIAGFEQIV